MKGTIAYCAAPRAGGIFAHYRAMREALAPRGWTVYAVSVGQSIARLWQSDFVDEGCIRVAEDTTDPQTAARALIDWCATKGIDVLFLSAPDYSLPAWDAIQHAPAAIRVVSHAYDTTPFSYRAVVIHPDRLSAVIATSQRQFDDLLGGGYVNRPQLHLIPHTVRETFLAAGDRRGKPPASDPMRLGYAGRLHDPQKGIFILPELGRRLSHLRIPWTLEVLGEGPDEQALAERFVRAGAQRHVRFHGRRSREDVAAHMARWDAFIMPSHHEGFGIALIEAMAAGAVPIVHRIGGVTDWIVEDESTGFVMDTNKPRVMAERVALLYHNPELRRNMSDAARRAVRARFHPNVAAEAYDTLFTELCAREPTWSPLPWSAFTPARFKRHWLQQTAHRLLPTQWKTWLRNKRARPHIEDQHHA